MIFMIGRTMLDTWEELILADPDLREYYMDTRSDSSRGRVWHKIPSNIHIRFWPEQNPGSSFNAQFRYTDSGKNYSVDVYFNRRSSELPFTEKHRRLRENIIADMALNRVDGGWHLWYGMALQPKTAIDQQRQQWDQNHVFFVARNHDTNLWGDVISLHYDSIMFPGHWQETEQYQDWRYNSRKIIT